MATWAVCFSSLLQWAMGTKTRSEPAGGVRCGGNALSIPKVSLHSKSQEGARARKEINQAEQNS